MMIFKDFISYLIALHLMMGTKNRTVCTLSRDANHVATHTGVAELDHPNCIWEFNRFR